LSRQDGQTLILLVIVLPVLLGFAALAIDVGRAYLAQRQLQQAVDAAALAAGQNLPDSTTAKTEAIAYSAIGRNSHPSSMKAGVPTVTFKCLATLATENIPCQKDPTTGSPCNAVQAPNGCNAVQVTQTATVPTTFGRLFLSQFTVKERSTVGMRGGVARALDVMVVLDTTASMESLCGDSIKDKNGATLIPAGQSTKIDCAKEGVRTLLSGLLPCNQSLPSCSGQQPLDEAGLMVFPGLNQPGSFTHDSTRARSNRALEASSSSCPGAYRSEPVWHLPDGTRFPSWFLQSSDIGYGASVSYLIAPLSNDFKTSNSSGLNPASSLVSGVYWSSCPGASYPGNQFYGVNSMGGAGTYYTAALGAAQTALAADAARHAQPVIILLSDGDANAGTQPRCTSAVTAAASAAAQGTWVYSIIYDGSPGGCSGDTVDAYTAMGRIARNNVTPAVPDPTKFYCVQTTSRAGLPCQNAATLALAFQSIGTSLTAARIYPDNTQ